MQGGMYSTACGQCLHEVAHEQASEILQVCIIYVPCAFSGHRVIAFLVFTTLFATIMTPPFSRRDRQLYQRVYDAFENQVDGNSIASIRDEAVARHDDASTFIVAFSTILQSHNLPRGAPHWLPFNEILKDQSIAKQKRRWKSHLEHLAFVSMQWSPDVVSDYGWTAEGKGRDQLIRLYKCAQIHPHFENDFLPQLNLVWWLQYTADISSPNNWTARPVGPFMNKNLQFLLDLHKFGTITLCGTKINSGSAALYGKYIRTWTESKDGRVSLPGRMIDLQALRSQHWEMYALCTDKYGLLKQREHTRWTTNKPLPAAVDQELHSYPFGNGRIDPGIIANDRELDEEPATEGSRGGPGLAFHQDMGALAVGTVPNSATSSEPDRIPSDSVDCAPLEMDPRQTLQESRDHMVTLREEAFHESHYNLRPEDCLCGICQDLQSLFNKMCSDNLQSGTARLRQVRKEWLSHAKWASRGNPWSNPKERFSDFDIWSLNESSLERLAKDSHALKKPVIVTEAAQDFTAHSVDSIRSVIRDNHCENEVECFLALFSSNERPTASYFLRVPFQAHDPKFMRFGRFTVLQRAAMRAFNSLMARSDDSDQCCNDSLHTSFLTSGLSSVRVETTGAAGGPRISALGGSWFRCLVGKMLYALIETPDLHSMQSDLSSASGQDQLSSPSGRVRLILLEPNDVLILPPGTAFLHFAVDPSATLEGYYWDERDVHRYLEVSRMAMQQPSFASDIPHCVFRRVFDGYQSIACGRESEGAYRQRPIDHAGGQLSKKSRSFFSPEGPGVDDATSDASVASSSSPPNPAKRTESDTRRGTGEHGASCRYSAKRMCIR